MTTPERDPGYPYGEFNAHEWAIEFDRIYPDRRPDTDTMLAWFANAIMTGYDRGTAEQAATIATLRAALDAGTALLGYMDYGRMRVGGDEANRAYLAAWRAARAALATAKEAGG